jgi:ferredoxin-NADP reductase
MPPPSRLRCKVASLLDPVEGVRILTLSPERPTPRFRPGQFLHLALDPYDPSQHWPESRVFSIASPPEAHESLEVAISAVGGFTRRILALSPGDEVWVKLPYGDFFVEAEAGRPTVLVAGGTGITPFLSLLRASTPLPGTVGLLYGVREPRFLIYADALRQASKRHPHFTWSAFIERGAMDGAHFGRPTAQDAVALAGRLGGAEKAVYYISGPPGMITSLRAELLALDVPLVRIRIDAWA